MARWSHLWLCGRGCDCYFDAEGNVDATKGSLLLWAWRPVNFPFGDDCFWRLLIDDDNWFRQRCGVDLKIGAQGTEYTLDVPNSTERAHWASMIYTWDLTDDGNGVVRGYFDGAEDPASPLTGVKTPVGTPQKLQLGPLVSAEDDKAEARRLYSIAVWDDVMTAEQAAALHVEGPRRTIRESDGTGDMTFLAMFNGQYDADVAAGDGTFHIPEGYEDRLCLMDDGARERGRRAFLIGMPRHDLSDDDRVPLGAVCPVSRSFDRHLCTIETNETNHGKLECLPGYAVPSRRHGATTPAQPVVGLNGGLAAPCTYRQRIHIANDDTAPGMRVSIGPVDWNHWPTEADNVYNQWGSGRSFQVVDDVGNSASQFKTDLPDKYVDDYWNGAWVTLISDNCEGYRAQVADYVHSTRTLVLATALPAVPASDSRGIVDHRARLTGRHGGTTLAPECNMDASLWEFHSDTNYFTTLEWLFPEDGSGFLRYGYGRTAYMPGASANLGDDEATYGRTANHGLGGDGTFYTTILLDSVEIDGPTAYQFLERLPSGAGPDYADNFLVIDAQTEESTKVWRKRNVARCRQKPTKVSDPTGLADLQESGSWRETVRRSPVPVESDVAGERIIAIVEGEDSGGTLRAGYVIGTWDEASERILWEDETAPDGYSNPFIEMSTLRSGNASDIQCASSWITGVYEMEDGTWALVYGAQTSHPDHYLSFLLDGAPNRYAFSRHEHWWPGNPLVPYTGGVDMVNPNGNGSGIWGNRQAAWCIARNECAHDASERFVGLCAGKTVHHKEHTYGGDMRPPIGVRGSDLRSMQPVPHGNSLSPLAGREVHAPDVGIIGQADAIALFSDTASGHTSGVYYYISEDGIHFQQYAHYCDHIPYGELPGEPSRLRPGRPFRLGDKMIYYYHSGDFVNLAWVRWNGEAYYELEDGATEGFFETPLIAKPAGGWGELSLNVAPGDGEITVEVLDGESDDALAGFSSSDFDGVGDSVEHVAKWNGLPLTVTATDVIRLRLALTTDEPSGEMPRVYSWRMGESAPPSAPSVSDLRLEGQVDPPNVADASPDFSWQYDDVNGFPQEAYHLLVSSTRENLDASVGDVWDTGELEGSDTTVTYAGSDLESRAVYYWKVRARNSQGVWSEEW